MFPMADYSPAGGGEPSVGLGVALTVLYNLQIPVVAVGSWALIVIRATMPKAAVNEDRDLGPGEDDVGCATQVRYWPAVHSESEAGCMK